ncbi:Cell surface superoxide dismutase [Cu-Zn] 4 [Rhizina undulata]
MQIKNTILATAVLASGFAAAAVTSSGYASATASSSGAVSSSTDAPKITNNPTSKTYVADFGTSKSSVVRGTITFTSPDGKGVDVAVDLGGFDLPVGSGPFAYHVHVGTVPSDGNCTATGGHLDPYDRGMATACDAAEPETCQVGDLSGKHGKIPEITGWSNYSTVNYPVVLSYNDAYLALNTADASFIGNRSIVIHNINDTRIACVNIVESTSSSNSSNSTSAKTEASTGAASGLTTASGFAMGIAGLVAFAFAL